jgi:NitT/TauT family transport system substrate-binding protein
MLTGLAALLVAWMSALPLAATAADRMVLCLNWAPGADHAALYHARAEGWFAEAELATEIRPGGGSGDALDRLEAGECDAAIADYAAVVAARARGLNPLGILTVFADSPLAFFSVRPLQVETLADLAGRRIAADPRELARRLWPLLMQRNGLADLPVQWLDTPNNAKVEALAAGTAEVAASTFYHHAMEFERAFGERLSVIHWRDHGVNPYANVLAVRESVAGRDPSLPRRLAEVVQRAQTACSRNPTPCLDALLAANTHLDRDVETARWRLAAPLMAPRRLAGAVMGAFESGRPGTACDDKHTPCTNEFLSRDHRIP